jgi:hypothetical protein
MIYEMVNKERQIKTETDKKFWWAKLKLYRGLRLFPIAFFPTSVKSEYSAIGPINSGVETQQPLQQTTYQLVER